MNLVGSRTSTTPTGPRRFYLEWQKDVDVITKFKKKPPLKKRLKPGEVREDTPPREMVVVDHRSPPRLALPLLPLPLPLPLPPLGHFKIFHRHVEPPSGTVRVLGPPRALLDDSSCACILCLFFIFFSHRDDDDRTAASTTTQPLPSLDLAVGHEPKSKAAAKAGAAETSNAWDAMGDPELPRPGTDANARAKEGRVPKIAAAVPRRMAPGGRKVAPGSGKDDPRLDPSHPPLAAGSSGDEWWRKDGLAPAPQGPRGALRLGRGAHRERRPRGCGRGAALHGGPP